MRIPSLAVCTLVIIAAQDFNRQNYASASEAPSSESEASQPSESNHVVVLPEAIATIAPPEALAMEPPILRESAKLIKPEVATSSEGLEYPPPV